MTPTQLAKGGSEHAHQVALFAWANMAASHGFAAANDPVSYACREYTISNYGVDARIESLSDMFAIPNGGERHAAVAANLKAEGVKSGVSDIFLPVPVGIRHGLFIELKKPALGKKPAGRLTEAQSAFIVRMLRRGYAATGAIGWEEATRIIICYYGGTL